MAGREPELVLARPLSHTHTHTHQIPGSPFAACLEQKRCDISSCVSPGAGDPDLLDYSALLPLLE